MKKTLFLTIALFAWYAVAYADGEQRNHEQGTRWVDPVEFFELQEIGHTDFQRDYDQGDIDFNKVMKKKGLKVYGLRLKPFCAAGIVEKYTNEAISRNTTISYQDLYGLRGIPLNEAAFCVYFDEGVSRSYTIGYTIVESTGRHNTWTVKCTDQININGLQLVSSGDGIGFSYAMNEKGSHKTYVVREGVEDQEYADDHAFICDKPTGANEKLGHFIYFRGARDLIVMISAPAKTINVIDDTAPDRRAMMANPWSRVYFFVEEILVEDDGGPILSEEDRQELVTYLDGLTTWLSGEGDPLGLGEHTDATTSAVIGAIGTIASILLGNGLAGMLGGGAGSLVDSLINSATSGANPLPGSDAPDLTKMDGLKGRKPEEEEEKEEETPPEENLDFFNKYTITDADGDIHVKDPVTGKETLYINNGDGTYRNFNTDQDWSPEEINEQLRYRDENSGPLKQDAETAARNAAEQHEQWEKESQELSKDGQDYLKWKHEQEAAEKKQEQINKLAQKYGVPPTEKAVANAIKYEQAINQIDADTNKDLADQYDQGIKTLGIIDKTCEIGVNVMATCVPGGAAVKDAYTFAKATLVAASEAVAEGKSVGEGVAHVLVGMGNGALGVVQNQAGDLAGNGKYAWVKELGINVATEDLKEGMNTYYKTGDLAKARDAMLNATGKKAVEFGVGKGIGAAFGKLKESATNSLAGNGKMSESMAHKVDYWFNKKHTYSAGDRTTVFKIIKVSEEGKVSWGGFSEGFSIFHSGAIDTGKLTEGVINETFNQAGAYNWAGNLTVGANNMAVDAAANVAYGAGVVTDAAKQATDDIVNFAKDVKNFSNLAASFRKK